MGSAVGGEEDRVEGRGDGGFLVDDVAGSVEHLREHGVKLIREQPLFIEKVATRIAFF